MVYHQGFYKDSMQLYIQGSGFGTEIVLQMFVPWLLDEYAGKPHVFPGPR